jgi:hypothetical protein
VHPVPALQHRIERTGLRPGGTVGRGERHPPAAPRQRAGRAGAPSRSSGGHRWKFRKFRFKSASPPCLLGHRGHPHGQRRDPAGTATSHSSPDVRGSSRRPSTGVCRDMAAAGVLAAPLGHLPGNLHHPLS